MEDTHAADSAPVPHMKESQQFSDSEILVLKEVMGDLLTGAVGELKKSMSGLTDEMKALRSDMDVICTNLVTAEHKMDAIATSMQTLTKRVDYTGRTGTKSKLQQRISLLYSPVWLNLRTEREDLNSA
ncbi:UNVERIFIED_CONTAM: hypothetical protein FKN15_038530 [Acipenser sinensis]